MWEQCKRSRGTWHDYAVPDTLGQLGATNGFEKGGGLDQEYGATLR